MSSNLRNGKYVFYGQQLSKEEYEEKLKNINYSPIEMAKEEFFKGVLPITIKRPLPKKIHQEK